MVSAEIPQCSRHLGELLFLIFVLGLNLLLLLNDWPLWLKRMGQRRTALRVIVRQSLPNLRHLYQNGPPFPSRKGVRDF
jgi:hypothetical protein